MISRTACRALALILALLLFVMPSLTLSAPLPTSDEDVRRLLEQSLSITEIDKEIDRIREQKTTLAAEMEKQAGELRRLEQQAKLKQEEASEVLRAYYMGERDALLSALLSVGSISELLELFDFVRMIIKRDKIILTEYKQQLASLQEGYLKLEEQQAGLDEVENKLSLQRERVLAMEEQLDEELNGRSDADRLRMMIEQLNSFWETAGLYEVEQYFNALSEAMRELPDWVQNNKEYLEMNGLNYTLRIPEDGLNEFLRAQNELFNDFEFRFKDGLISASGTRNDIEISVTGHYTVVEEPRNGLLFHVDELLFNGFALPDTTRRELERKFDLGFYPSLIVSFVKANSVEMEDGELVVKLGMSW